MERYKRAPAIPPDTSTLSSHSRLRVAAQRTASSEYAMRYGAMREVLLRYLSPILVDSVLDRAMKARHLNPRSLTPAELAELASDIMVGLRLFVPEERLSQLMLDLAEVLELPA